MRYLLMPVQVEPFVREAVARHKLAREFGRITRRQYIMLLANLVAEHVVVYDDGGDDAAAIGALARRWRR